MDTTVWWTCPGCGVDAELAGSDGPGVEVLCPDCDGPMAEQWRWETAA